MTFTLTISAIGTRSQRIASISWRLYRSSSGLPSTCDQFTEPIRLPAMCRAGVRQSCLTQPLSILPRRQEGWVGILLRGGDDQRVVLSDGGDELPVRSMTACI